MLLPQAIGFEFLSYGRRLAPANQNGVTPPRAEERDLTGKSFTVPSP